MRADRFFKFEHGEPVEIPLVEAGYNFLTDTCREGVTRVSPAETPIDYTIHCAGSYAPGELATGTAAPASPRVRIRVEASVGQMARAMVANANVAGH